MNRLTLTLVSDMSEHLRVSVFVRLNLDLLISIQRRLLNERLSDERAIMQVRRHSPAVAIYNRCRVAALAEDLSPRASFAFSDLLDKEVESPIMQLWDLGSRYVNAGLKGVSSPSSNGALTTLLRLTLCPSHSLSMGACLTAWL